MNKTKVKEHYDFLSPYYLRLWGDHIHHGYWIQGDESKEEAEINLVKLLIEKSGIREDAKILDVGCGVGGSSIYLTKNLGAKLTGITLSSVQVDIANRNANENGVNVEFVQCDAENFHRQNEYDAIWSIEAISHFDNQETFFANIAESVKKAGIIAVIDWFKAENLSSADVEKYIDPIRKGMLTPNMKTMSDYKLYLENAGFVVTNFVDISSNVSKTWDISLKIIRNPRLWLIAIMHGKDFINFLRSFRAMRNGFKSKKFVYGLITAELPKY